MAAVAAGEVALKAYLESRPVTAHALRGMAMVLAGEKERVRHLNKPALVTLLLPLLLVAPPLAADPEDALELDDGARARLSPCVAGEARGVPRRGGGRGCGELHATDPTRPHARGTTLVAPRTPEVQKSSMVRPLNVSSSSQRFISCFTFSVASAALRAAASAARVGGASSGTAS